MAMKNLGRRSHQKRVVASVLAVAAAVFVGQAFPSHKNVFFAPRIAVESNSATQPLPVGLEPWAQPLSAITPASGNTTRYKESVFSVLPIHKVNAVAREPFDMARTDPWDTTDAGGATVVPRHFPGTFPKHIHRLESVDERKQIFIRSLLPLVLRANESISADRQAILALRDRWQAEGLGLTPRDQFWLARVAARYEVARTDIDALLRRVDVIPPSLALAQAAEESGWGTSRFAREGNAVFGQYTFNQGAGLIPKRRDAGKRHEIKAFAVLHDSVASYMLNLNSHPAYKAFRDRRATLRAENRDTDGIALAATLTRYSQRGAAYVKTIQAIIRVNDLTRFDQSRLATEEASPEAPPA